MIIIFTNEPLEIVLNSMAVFFMLSLDNIIVPKMHIGVLRENLQVCLERSLAYPSLPVVVPSKVFFYPLKVTQYLVVFVFSALLVQFLCFYVLFLQFLCSK